MVYIIKWMIINMKRLITYINEELDENIFWLLDKWFENNEQDKQWFIELLVKYKTDKTRKTVETYVHDIPNEHLIQFVSFIDNNLTSDKQLDYIYKLQQILDICVTNKGKQNKYK